MPKALEEKLKKEYPGEEDAPFKIMNKLGFMKGNKETAKGRAFDKKHPPMPKKKLRGPRRQAAMLEGRM